MQNPTIQRACSQLLNTPQAKSMLSLRRVKHPSKFTRHQAHRRSFLLRNLRHFLHMPVHFIQSDAFSDHAFNIRIQLAIGLGFHQPGHAGHGRFEKFKIFPQTGEEFRACPAGLCRFQRTIAHPGILDDPGASPLGNRIAHLLARAGSVEPHQCRPRFCHRLLARAVQILVPGHTLHVGNCRLNAGQPCGIVAHVLLEIGFRHFLHQVNHIAMAVNRSHRAPHLFLKIRVAFPQHRHVSECRRAFRMAGIFHQRGFPTPRAFVLRTSPNVFQTLGIAVLSSLGQLIRQCPALIGHHHLPPRRHHLHVLLQRRHEGFTPGNEIFRHVMAGHLPGTVIIRMLRGHVGFRVPHLPDRGTVRLLIAPDADARRGEVVSRGLMFLPRLLKCRHPGLVAGRWHLLRHGSRWILNGIIGRLFRGILGHGVNGRAFVPNGIQRLHLRLRIPGAGDR